MRPRFPRDTFRQTLWAMWHENECAAFEVLERNAFGALFVHLRQRDPHWMYETAATLDDCVDDKVNA